MDETIAAPVPIVHPRSLWIMRGLAIAALAIAGFLAVFDVWFLLDATRTKVPYCSWAPEWFDCDAVIFHPKWSNWLGIPVAAIGAPLYLAVTVGLFMVRVHPVRPQFRLWLLLHTAAIAVLGAAAWFVFLQVWKIEKICQYCMAEHAIGAVLALMIVSNAGRLFPRGRSIGTLVALAGVAALIAGQLIAAPPVVSKVVIGTLTDDKRYVEPGATLRILGGAADLNAGAHLMLGPPDAPRIIVEAIDYTCPRCRALFEMLEEARPLLGDGYAILVLTYPLGHGCNKHQAETEPRHRDACELAKLAHAVWLTDAAKYPEFHAWLFRQQDRFTLVEAIDHARSLVGPSRLDGFRADADGKPAQLVRRDIDIAFRLLTEGDDRNVPALPGLFAADSRFSYLPDSAKELADTIRGVFDR